LKPASINVAKVDCTTNQKTCQDHGVGGYPTIKLFKNGVTHDFQGDRNLDSMSQFAKGFLSTETETAKKDQPAKREEAKSDVVTLSTSDFDSKIKSGSWLVEFYAPWCGHCKQLAPIWEDLATSAKGIFNVAKVDCTVDKELASQYGIKGFPTIKLLLDGQQYDYRGKRTIEDFTSFVTGGYKQTEGTAAPKSAHDEL